MTSETRDQMLELAQQQCNGALDEAALAHLEQLLAADAALRREYIRFSFLHAHLTQVDEFVRAALSDEQLREWTDADELKECLAELPEISLAARLQHAHSGALATRRAVALSAAALAGAAGLLAALLAFLMFVPPPGRHEVWENSIATITGTTDALWVDNDAGHRQGQYLGPGTLRLKEGSADVKFRSGAQIGLDGPATLGLESQAYGSLFSGRLFARMDEPTEPFVLQAAGVRVLDRGTGFGVEVDPGGVTEVHCIEGAIETQARARLPMFYWSFDQVDGRIYDNMSRRVAQPGPAAKPAGGLIGGGAVSFDNTRAALVNVGNGGGTQIGTGEFGVASGLTIEALTIVRWSGDGVSNGRPKDYDEIFRKEDGPNRMLLCFQNDDGARQRNVPAMDVYGPTLSFGLHLAGDGYSELEVRLDGNDGRPSLDDLRDERPHHIVATYDSWNGVKALYIDGVLLQKATFPKGTLIVSGGPTDAIIGNMAGGVEPYNGIIDEVAIYDFALAESEVANHWANVQQGKNYFGAPSSDAVRGRAWNVTARLAAGQAMQFDSATGLPLGKIPVDYQRFRRVNAN